MTTADQQRFVIPFSQLGIADVPLVGGKNASLREMVQHLTPAGVKIPDGFAITAEAYRHFLKHGKLDEQIALILRGIDTCNIQNLQERGQRIRQTRLNGQIPDDLAEGALAFRRASAFACCRWVPSRGTAWPAGIWVACPRELYPRGGHWRCVPARSSDAQRCS